MTRRFVPLLLASATAVIWFAGLMNASAAEPRTVRDAMWIWAHPKGSYDNQWKLPGNSKLAPMEGARSLGVSNVILIHYEGKPKPPLADYAAEFRGANRLMWSVTGAGGTTSAAERDEVFALAAKMPNLTGVFMDDFFHFQANTPTNDKTPASLSVDALQSLRKRLDLGNRKLDLGVTLYTYQLDKRIVSHLQHCDVVSLWTWEAPDLVKLEENFAKFESLAPGKRVLLGIYMWDFGKCRPIPMDLMQKQCRLALQWLQEGRIEGMIFLATNICDLNLEAVDWSRKWIAEVGDRPLTVKKR